jgi:hypothetical protein
LLQSKTVPYFPRTSTGAYALAPEARNELAQTGRSGKRIEKIPSPEGGGTSSSILVLCLAAPRAREDCSAFFAHHQKIRCPEMRRERSESSYSCKAAQKHLVVSNLPADISFRLGPFSWLLASSRSSKVTKRSEGTAS